MKRTWPNIVFVGAVALVLLAVFVVPAFIRAWRTSASNSCVMNLRQITGAKETWALDHKKETNAVVSWSGIKPYLSHEEVPHCPDGGTYSLGLVGQPPRCSLAPTFIGGKSHELLN